MLKAKRFTKLQQQNNNNNKLCFFITIFSFHLHKNILIPNFQDEDDDYPREKSFKSVPELPDIVNAKGQKNRVMLIRVFYWILEMEKKFPRILHLEIYCLAMHMMIWLGPIKFRLVP